MPAAIEPILSDKREALDPARTRCAVFYSISNCQRGLNSISFGNFLIKQVVEELKRDFPHLKTFATLSPVPGFRRWVEAEMAKADSPFIDPEARIFLGDESIGEHDDPETLRLVTNRLLARYFLDARDARGRVLDPVARFHLGNGARLERLNPLADFSEKGWRDSYAAMVNYLYDLPSIEENHEQFAIGGVVAASADVQKALVEARSFTGARPGAPALPRAS
jgi:malonyl-CoA decarboxylase